MTARLSVNDLHVNYGGDPVLAGISAEIPAGEITTLIGPNGCGKSTLLLSMCGLLDYTGSITHGGAPIAKMKPRERARSIALLPQSPVAPERISVGQLVARGRHPHHSWFQQWTVEDEQKVEEALRTVGVEAFADKELQNLSGGQRQRAWIAMTVAQDTPTLLLDEPTTYLDLAHSIEILRLVRTLRDTEKKTIVMVLHDLNLAIRYSDHLIVMDSHGKIVATGHPWKIITPDLLWRTFCLDAVVVSDPETGGPLIVPRKDVSGSARELGKREVAENDFTEQ